MPYRTEPPGAIASNGWVGIVDDDKSIRRSLIRLLRVLGVRGEAFGSADEYLEQVLSSPRCLLIDVQLGTSTGFELFDRLVARDAVVPPVIFISANDDPATLRRAQTSGARGWLRKPFTAVALLELIEPHLSGDEIERAVERDGISLYSAPAVANRER